MRKSGSCSVHRVVNEFCTFPERSFTVKLFTYVNARRFKSELLCVRESTLKRRQNESNGNIVVLQFDLWLILALR